MKKQPIVLIVVQGGVAYEYSKGNVHTRIVDVDNLKAGYIDDNDVNNNFVNLPEGIGFEELIKQADVKEFVKFVKPE